MGLSPATKPFFCGNRRAEGPGRAVGRRAGDSQVPLWAASIPFPVLYVKPVERETAGLFIPLWGKESN